MSDTAYDAILDDLRGMLQYIITNPASPGEHYMSISPDGETYLTAYSLWALGCFAALGELRDQFGQLPDGDHELVYIMLNDYLTIVGKLGPTSIARSVHTQAVRFADMFAVTFDLGGPLSSEP